MPPWDGAAYAANTAHHRAHDADFLATTPLQPAHRVLDLGCGAGDLTARIAGLVPDGHVVGVDAQPSMLEEARRRSLANQSFIASDLQHLDGALASPGHDGAYDVVVSRAVLHWVPRADWPGVLRSVARLVRPGGHVRIECGGAGNVRRVVAMLDAVAAPFGGPTRPWTFLDAGAALDLLEASGLDVGRGGFVRTIGQRRPFDDESIRGWLHSQALQAYEASMPAEHHPAFRRAVEEQVGELRRADGTLDQTYVRLDALARRPE